VSDPAQKPRGVPSLAVFPWLAGHRHGTAGESAAFVVEETLVDRIKWTTFARVGLLTAVLALAVAMDIGVGPRPLTTMPETTLYRLTTTFYALSFFFLLATQLLRNSPRIGYLSAASMAVDMLLAISLVAVTDGVKSLFVFAFLIAVLNSALLLYRAGAMVAASLSTVALTIMAAMELGWLPWSLAAVRVAYLRGLAESPPMALYEMAAQLFVQISAVWATAFLSAHLVLELDRARLRNLAQRRELASLRVRYGDVVSSLPDGLLTVSPTGIISSINPAGLEILGLSAAAVVGMPLLGVLPELADLEPAGQDPGLRRRGASYTRELARDCGAAGAQILACRVVRLHDPHAAADTLVLYRDMTEVRAREEAHRNRERLAGIGSMAATVAHEIRNPLASISGAVQMLQGSGELTETDKQLMAIVVRETHQLSDWISEFLDFARPRPVQMERCDLRAIAQETLDACRSDEHFTAGEIDVGPLQGVEPGSDFTLMADHHLVRQTVWNLLVNAAQAVLSVEKRIVNVHLSPRPDTIELVVEDSGHGVDTEDVAHVFEPFYTTKGEGTGLGLATVARHVAAHRGRIEVGRSSLGGARFVLTLPRQPGGEAAFALGAARSEADSSGPESATPTYAI